MVSRFILNKLIAGKHGVTNFSQVLSLQEFININTPLIYNLPGSDTKVFKNTNCRLVYHADDPTYLVIKIFNHQEGYPIKVFLGSRFDL